jgi:hypothetical protein
MKVWFLVLLIFHFCCNVPVKKEETQVHAIEEPKPAYRKNSYAPIVSSDISKIILYTADTSILNPPEKINVFSASIGTAPSLLDSSGKPCVKPSQTLLLKDVQKDSLIDIFNKFLLVPQDTTLGSNCLIFYTHVFVLYDLKGKIVEQIHLCLGCTKLNYIHRGAFLQFIDQERSLFSALLRRLKIVNAYLPADRSI